jgi:hypothetical protein
MDSNDEKDSDAIDPKNIEGTASRSLLKIFVQPSFSTDTDPHWGEVLLVSAVIEGHLTAAVIHSSAKNMLRVLSMRKYP